MLKPMHNMILVKRNEEEVSAGGIIISTQAQQGSMKANEGEIIAIGPSVVQGIEKGDKILFGKYSGAEVEHEGDNLVLMKDDDVLCKVI